MNCESVIIVLLINVKIVRQNIGKTLINLIHSVVQNVSEYVIVNNELVFKNNTFCKFHISHISLISNLIKLAKFDADNTLNKRKSW